MLVCLILETCYAQENYDNQDNNGMSHLMPSLASSARVERGG